MAVQLTINNKTFTIPSPGEDPGWGGDTTDWIKEANAVISSLFGPGDILQSSFNIANSVTDQDILGLSFNPSIVRAAEIQYSVYRESDLNPTGNTETGLIRISYDNNATAGNKWQISQDYDGDAGVTFDIIDEASGQLTYTSNDINATGYSGVMKFRAKALSQ